MTPLRGDKPRQVVERRRLAEDGQRIKVRRSRYSKLCQTEVRRVLAIVHTIADVCLPAVGDTETGRCRSG